MKRILKKNQLIIAALAVMIAAAGYLNYSGRLLPGSQNTKEAGSDSLSDAQKQDAVAQMVAMTEIAEKETAAETMLASKGFLDSVVSISEDSADVVVNASELTEANRAQIEDIVTRKTGVAAQNIVITPVYAEGK